MAQAAADHPPPSLGVDNWKLGFWTFIGSECLFFGTLISAYLVYKGNAVTGPYPEDLWNIPLTTLSTATLLFSSLAIVLALEGVKRSRKRFSLTWLGVTILMGASFLGIEAYEYSHFISEGLTLTTSTFGSSYYVLTGTHKIHVALGMIWLGTLWWMIYRDRMPPKDALKLEIAGIYWHFVDIIWIIIFTLVYLIG